MGHHDEQESVGVDGVARAAADPLGSGDGSARGSQSHDQNVGNLVDEHEHNGPASQPEGVAQPAATEVEAGPIADTGLPEVDEEDEELRHNSQRGAKPENKLLGGAVRTPQLRVVCRAEREQVGA